MPGQKPDPTGAKILDGAMRALGDFGLKRATVELVARYAGVSHMTIYRRWPSKNDLLRAAIIGAFTTLLDTAFDHAAESGTSFADQTLNAFTDLVWALQSHPLVLRELNTESGEPSLMLPSSSSAVMEVSVPLVAERLERAGLTIDDTPEDLDPVADVFVRLAYSLVIVKRPGHPLATRDEVADYAGERFGPYLQAVTEKADLPAADAVVIDFDQRGSGRKRAQRPYLQIAAASIFSVLTVGAGLTAVLGGRIEIPFLTPANFSRPSTATIPTNVPPGSPEGANRGTAEPQLAGAPSQQSAPGSPAPQLPADSSAPRVISPQIVSEQPAAALVGPAGTNSAIEERPSQGNPVQVLAPAPPPAPQPLAPQPPAPQPLAPKPPPPQPPPPQPLAPQPLGPKPPGPGPQPGPAPKPPAPKPPGPGPGPKPPGPGPGQGPGPGPGPGPGQGPGPKPPGTGSGSGSGSKSPGSAHQSNQKSGPSH